MPITIKRKEFVMALRDWEIKSSQEKVDFLKSMGFDIYQTKILKSEDSYNTLSSHLIKFVQDFKEYQPDTEAERKIEEYKSTYPYIDEWNKYLKQKMQPYEKEIIDSLMRTKEPEVKGLQVIKFEESKK